MPFDCPRAYRYDSCFSRVSRRPAREPNEAYVSAESPPPQADPWFPCSYGHQERPHRPEAPARQGPQAPHRQHPVGATATPRPCPAASPPHVCVPEIPPFGALALAARVCSRAGTRPAGFYEISDRAGPDGTRNIGPAWSDRVQKIWRRCPAQSRKTAAPRGLPATGPGDDHHARTASTRYRGDPAARIARRAVRRDRSGVSDSGTQTARDEVTAGRRIGLLIIHGYQLLLAPFTGGACRFEPSCSVYAIEAVTRHGLIRGGWVALRRVVRCHPFAHARIDPV
jgi:uncharacterized protein